MLSNLLGPLTPDAAAVDSLFLSLYPLDALLETSVALPLITQYVFYMICIHNATPWPVPTYRSQLVNQALLEYFFNNCTIKSHFVALKRFLLLEDGEFAHVLSTGLCEQLAYGSSWRSLCSSSFLNPLLSFALESSVHGRCPQAQRLAFKLKHQPSMIHNHG